MPDDSAIPRVIQRGAPNAVIYDLSTPRQVTITLPAGSTWTSGLHWHETHTEYLCLTKGSVRVRLGLSERVITASGTTRPEIKIDRHVRHEWRRAEPGGEDVVVVERTEPADNEKAVFFWNLNGVILKAQRTADDPASLLRLLPGWLKGFVLDIWVPLNLFVIFHNLDNIPVFLDIAGFLANKGFNTTEGAATGRASLFMEGFFSHFVLAVASWIGWVLGIKPVRREFTPEAPFKLWWSTRDVGGKPKVL